MPPQEMEYPPAMMHPMAMASREKCITLLGPHEPTQMSVEDRIACQNIELFEATAEDIVEFTRNGADVVAKQVGLRCIHSGRIPASTLFPGSLGDIAKCVRTLMDNHLSVNERVPPEVRETCKRAASKRSREQQHGEEGNESNNDRDLMQLIGHCVDFCNRLRIVNKQPHKSGIEFSNLQEMGQYSYPVTTPVAAGRGSMQGPYSAERYMMGMDRMTLRQGPPGVMARGPPPAAMMGRAPGPEGIAATPLQSTRNREGVPYPGERDAANQAGYPPQYAQGGSPPQFGRPDGPPGEPNPPQASYEGQEQGSVTEQRPDGSPPRYPEMGQYDLPPHFPFYQERDRTWQCKYCSHVPPQYREPQSVWSSPNSSPPPGSFIDEHLSICRFYHQTISSQHIYQGASYAPSVFGPQHAPAMYGPPPGPWNANYASQPGFPYPGGMPEGRYPEEAYEDQRRGPAGPRANLLGPPSSAVGGPPTRGSAPPAIPRQENSGDIIRSCISHLVMKEREYYARDPENSKIPRLVLEDDRLLLTDYFFYLMKQLRLCRFSESDRKTRGGKREKIKIGYGGLQCVHCADVPNSRKFFWSNVDRLANSFAEIPGHILKCRRCPTQTKEALMTLKSFHPEQMARLPRGSQKVFFRRMWRRLHDEDPVEPGIKGSLLNEENVTPEQANKDRSESKGEDAKKDNASPTIGSPKSDDGSLPILSAKEAAEALAKSLTQDKDSPPGPKILLAIGDDKNWLSDMDCFIRKQIEVFCATEEDVASAQADRKYPVKVRQVGIRCIHCSASAVGATGQAVSYPYTISGIYESVREFQRLHLDSCENITEETQLKLHAFRGSSSLSSVLRKYYVSAARALGLQDSPKGIRTSGESISITLQGAFTTPEPQQSAHRGIQLKMELRPEQQAKPSGSSRREEAKTGKEPTPPEGSAPDSDAPTGKDAEKSEAESKSAESNVSENAASESKAPENNESESKASDTKTPNETESESIAPERYASEDKTPERKKNASESNITSGKKRTSPTIDSEPPAKVAKT